MGPVGWQEMVIIFIVALVLFGPKKLPELGRTLGKAITEFRRASNELKATFDREMQSLEREHESLKEVTSSSDARGQCLRNHRRSLRSYRRVRRRHDACRAHGKHLRTLCPRCPESSSAPPLPFLRYWRSAYAAAQGPSSLSVAAVRAAPHRPGPVGSRLLPAHPRAAHRPHLAELHRSPAAQPLPHAHAGATRARPRLRLRRLRHPGHRLLPLRRRVLLRPHPLRPLRRLRRQPLSQRRQRRRTRLCRRRPLALHRRHRRSRPATNLAVPVEFPKLARRYGNVVNYAQGEHQHVQTEFAFDINEIAHHRLAPVHYLRHVGLEVPTKQLALAFYQTYGLREDFTAASRPPHQCEAHTASPCTPSSRASPTR